MREQEAALERADAQRRAAPCAARPELARSVCDAAREICELAQTLAETDAKERCGQARARCAELDGGAPCGKSSQ